MPKYESLVGTTGAIDFSAYDRGEPLKIDTKDWYIPALQNKIRTFLKNKGHPKVSLKTVYDTKPPFKIWITCDWKKGKATAIDRRNNSKYGEFFTKGEVRVLATHEDADNPGKLRTAVRTALARYGVQYYDVRVTEYDALYYLQPVTGFLFENLRFKKDQQ